MRVIAFDHFYGQDLDALESALGSNDVLIRLNYRRWHRLAERFFPNEAFSGLENAFDSNLLPVWSEYRRRVVREARWLCRAHYPDLLLLPSDSFFYVRPFIEAFRDLGIPTFVMQKETTISPMVMDEHSLQVGRFVPFMSDFMTVCSDRHRQFWIRSGADPDSIAVTGQPRFDVYAHRRTSPINRRKRLLYLSYDDAAYLPTDVGAEFDGSWRELRLETERAIAEFAGEWDVIVKVHPQQSVAESALGPKVFHADRYADTRDLIRDCDAVVGFQTTAIYEAAVCGKPVIYPAWGDTFDRVKSTLNRFESIPGLVIWARSGGELREKLGLDPGHLPPASETGINECEIHLGPVDGGASERAIGHMRAVARSGDVPDLDSVMFARHVVLSTLWPVAKVAQFGLGRLRPELSRKFGRVASDVATIFHEVVGNLIRRRSRPRFVGDGLGRGQ